MPNTPVIAVAWKGPGTGGQPLFASYSADDGESWQNIPNLNQSSSYGPALAFFNNALYLAWTGTDNQLNVISSPDGKTWTPQQKLGENASSAPTLAASGDILFLVYAGTDGDQSLNLWFYDSNTKSWMNRTTLDSQGTPTSQAPSSAVGPFQAPIIAWLSGTGVTKSVNCLVGIECMVGVGQSAASSATSAYGPALAFAKDLLYLAWTDGNGLLHVGYNPDGSNASWQFPPALTGSTSVNGPALAASDSTVYLAWAATGGSLQIVSLPHKPPTTSPPSPGTWTPTTFTVPTGAASGSAPALALGILNITPPTPAIGGPPTTPPGELD